MILVWYRPNLWLHWSVLLSLKVEKSFKLTKIPARKIGKSNSHPIFGNKTPDNKIQSSFPNLLYGKHTLTAFFHIKWLILKFLLFLKTASTHNLKTLCLKIFPGRLSEAPFRVVFQTSGSPLAHHPLKGAEFRPSWRRNSLKMSLHAMNHCLISVVTRSYKIEKNFKCMLISKKTQINH